MLDGIQVSEAQIQSITRRRIDENKHILYIDPQTHVRATQGDAIWFKIPEAKLAVKYPQGLLRKRRLERYNLYKHEIWLKAREAGFELPMGLFRIVFYISVPVSWSKKKKAAHHMQPHQSKPDSDNLVKAFFDSMLKEDKAIWDHRATKLWVNEPTGRIEIISKK